MQNRKFRKNHIIWAIFWIAQVSSIQHGSYVQSLFAILIRIISKRRDYLNDIRVFNSNSLWWRSPVAWDVWKVCWTIKYRDFHPLVTVAYDKDEVHREVTEFKNSSKLCTVCTVDNRNDGLMKPLLSVSCICFKPLVIQLINWKLQ